MSADVLSSSAAPIGVVIPALDEAPRIGAVIAGCAVLGAHEVVVVDGGSRDDTVAVARAHGARVVRGVRGRGPQCNAGAAATSAPLLCFLHADTRLPPDAGTRIREVCDRTGRAGGFFRLRLDAPGWGFRLIDFCAWIRSAWWGQPAGDQALFCTQRAFAAAGGFPAVPLFEDLEFARRLARTGAVEPVWAPVRSSARAYLEEGPWRRCWRNIGLRVAHARGVPHAELAARYARRSGRAAPPAEVVALMARAPERGRVKTRLAADIGDEAAFRVYTTLGQTVAERLGAALGPGRVGWAAITPPEACVAAGEWLGDPWRTLPQAEGDLGARLDAVVASAFACGAQRVLLFGTDCVTCDASDVAAAFAALRTHDAVLGPATDGGYWCLGVSRPVPELFRGIDWGTERVAAQTRAAAGRAGVRLAPDLRTLSDVDRLADLQAVRDELALFT